MTRPGIDVERLVKAVQAAMSEHARGPLCDQRACLDCAFNDGISFAVHAIRHAARTRKGKR